MRQELWKLAWGKPLLFLYGTLGVYLLVLIPRLIWRNSEGLWVGYEHLWSDYPLHIAMANRVAYTAPADWLAHHPMYAGEMLRYPMFAAIVSGTLIRLGWDVPMAIIAPTLLCFALLLPGMYLLWRLLLEDSWRPVLAIFLFFLSSGPGFVLWFRDFLQSPTLANLLYPTNTHARVEEYMWYSGNFLSGLLLPQRAFLPGLTLAVWILVFLLTCLLHTENEPPTWQSTRRRWLLLCGVLAGCLPLVHTHSYLALGVICLCLLPAVAGHDSKRWGEIGLLFCLPAVGIGLLLFFALLKPTTTIPDYMGIRVGWMAKGFADWFLMWWRLWGMALPMAVLGGVVLWREYSDIGNRWRMAFFYGVALLFMLANIVRFQPVQWDNSKLFLWNYLGFSGLMAVGVAWLWRTPNRTGIRAGVFRYLIAVPVAIYLMGTGFLEMVRLQYVSRHQARILSTEEMQLGEIIRRTTAPNDIFLTAMDIGSPPMVWGARPILMGFTGWMFNFGFDPGTRETAIRTMYAGGVNALPLLRQYQIRYILIGPSERYNFKPNTLWFDQNFSAVYRSPDFTLYAISP